MTVTSPALQGEQTVVTDKAGAYRIPNLPPGDYTLRLEGDSYKPYSRGGIALHVNTTIRVNAEMLPEGLKAEEVVVVGKAPTVDVGSASTGVTLNQDFVSRIALNPPGGKAAASRSFESLAGVAPGAAADTYGVSVAGTTSPENAFVIDGVSVNDPAFGTLGTPLSVEFVKELGVITGGYLPEYGKATGGIFDVVTKSGSNEFHGSVFFNITPGQLEGPRTPIKSASSVIVSNPKLGSLRDFGADIGGPIVKDKLWFYAGVQFAFNRQRFERGLSQFNYVPDPAHPGAFMQQFDKDGFPVTSPINCQIGQTCTTGPNGTPLPAGYKVPAAPIYYADETSIQYIGKLTYHINQDHNLTLSVYGTPTRSGGNGVYAFDNTGTPQVTAFNLNGSYESLANKYAADANDVSLKYSGAFNNKRQLLDITVGWHHQHQATTTTDGKGAADVNTPNGGLANIPSIIYRRNTPGFRAITDFPNERVPNGYCQPVQVWDDSIGGLRTTTPCPVETYNAGGPGYLDDITLDSYQGRAIFTNLLQAAGHHVIKAGVDFQFNSFRHDKAYTGGDAYREAVDSSRYDDARRFGFLKSPDDPVLLNHYVAKSTTISVGGFVQDSWSIFDKVTLNFGVRYDAQVINGADGKLGLALPNQWSPRVGVIYDFTQQGRSKLFANFARYYEGVPLDMADRSFPSEPSVYARHGADVCDPANTGSTSPNLAGCGRKDAGALRPGYWTTTNNPTQFWNRGGSSKTPVDPDIAPQSSDEFVVGGEYEVFSDARVGVTYTHRYLNKAIEDMSRDEANTYFLGNPGYGIAKDFPKAVRNYDAMTVYFTKNYSNTWLLQASYTLSRLYGNYAGLFRPETGQLDPNITSDFDLISLLRNRMGPLPGDSTHAIKIYAAKDFLLPAGQDILIGLTYRTRSGRPLNALGSHPIYLADEVYVVERGQGGTLNLPGPGVAKNKEFTINPGRGDWVHNIDLRVGYSIRLGKESTLGVTMDIFNVFNFQAAASRDQRYTNSDVLPCAKGGTVPTCVKHADPSQGDFDPAKEVNPNYGKPTLYQDPRQFRFGAKVTF
ncbi:Trehalose synthase [Minicystis rosea]|nr:Trehalose synthase [Minicystis rosea]